MQSFYSKQVWLILFSISAFYSTMLAQPCDNNGNIVIFSNYDGGYLNIDINIDIPNLKIGIASYEPTQVNISGTYATNVTEVHYAGYFPMTGTGNFHCDNNLAVGSVNPLPNPNAVITILSIPPVTLVATEYDTTTIPGFPLLIGENSGIFGCHSCNTTEYTGGDNTADQIIDYFATTLNGSVRFLKTQYGCWCGTLDMSQPNTCCQEIPSSSSGGNVSILSSSPYICDNQTVTLTALGNFDNYTWSNGLNTSSISVSNPGTYTLQASNDCGDFTGSITLEECPQEICNNGVDDDGDGLVDFLDPDCTCTGTPVTLNVVQTGTPCDPTITLQATFTPGSLYQWFLNDQPINTANQPDFTIPTNPASNGVYTVLAVDAAGNCSLSNPFTFTFTEPAVLTTVINEVLCTGANSGSISTSVSPAGNYLYAWADEQGSAIAGNTGIANVSAGTYSLTLTDGAGCTSTYSYTVTEPAELTLFADIVQPVCGGDSTGTITIAANGGVSPYSFAIDSNPGSVQTVYVLEPGIYTAGVIDDNGCETVLTGLAITAANVPALSISGPGTPVPIGETFVLTAISDQPSTALTYDWQPVSLLNCSDCPEVSGIALEDTVFTLTITDIGGCSATVEFSLSIDRTVAVFVPNVFSPDFSGVNDVFKVYSGAGVAGITYFRIFDRWGNLVSENVEGWDGRFREKDMPAGVYAWIAEIIYIDGGRELIKGDVTLVR
jgi:gliding motility-associated-like protein